MDLIVSQIKRQANVQLFAKGGGGGVFFVSQAMTVCVFHYQKNFQIANFVLFLMEESSGFFPSSGRHTQLTESPRQHKGGCSFLGFTLFEASHQKEFKPLTDNCVGFEPMTTTTVQYVFYRLTSMCDKQQSADFTHTSQYPTHVVTLFYNIKCLNEDSRRAEGLGNKSFLLSK